ncbi:MAG: rod shape-determining protein MreD [Candidatus Schmidhempelia sp.]|nr:rod shape-determining protein MreD [Candidatus Schmidhempelia sp.]
MNNRAAHNRWIIWLLLLVGILLQIMPWSSTIYMIKPNWLLLILVYWLLALPHCIGIGIAFFIGIVLDLFSGTVLGGHAFALSIVAYLTLFKFQLIRNLAIWQQLLIVVLLSICYDLLLFFIEILINHSIRMIPMLFLSSIVNGILWPWVFLLMRQIRRHFWIY